LPCLGLAFPHSKKAAMRIYHSLTPGDPKILEHFLAMTPEDRRCRFHDLISDERIVQYCRKMVGRDAHLIGCLERERLVGLIEIGVIEAGKERSGGIGMSVAADRRDCGIGHLLVQHAMDCAANRGLPLVFGYLPDNARIPRIALDLGGHVDRRGAAEIAPISACTLGLAAIDDIGLYVADVMALWKSALLAPLGQVDPPAPVSAA
jgi:GNAT superfamily N-acetyltransferase